jgi:hypothetical protein
MTVPLIPILNVQPPCPQCGAQLSVEHLGGNPEADDRVICPVHGDVGSYREIAAQVYEQNRVEIAKKAQDYFGKWLADGGFKV